VLTALLVLLVAARPSTPRVVAPKESVTAAVTFRFSAHERGVRRLRYRCGLDGQRPRACTSPYYGRLVPGLHVFRVQAIDSRGRRSGWGRALVNVLTPAKSLKVGTSPVAITFDGSRIWTADHDSGTVTRIDADTSAVARVKVGGSPGGVAAAGGSLWVGDFAPDGSLTRIDPGTNAVVARVETPAQPAGLLGDGDTLWVADYSGSVLRVDAVNGRVVARIPVGGKPEALAAGFGLLWVSNHDGTISTVDPATNAAVGSKIVGDPDVDSVAVGSDAVWATSFYGKTLLQIDPATRRVVRRIRLGGQGSGVLVAEGSVWASVYDEGEVLRISPVTGKVVERIRVGAGARELVYDGSDVWVACQRANAVSRIAP
jgi:YVTN family beta-propeller protein